MKRGETIKGTFVKWDNVDADVQVHPVIAALPESVIAGPSNDGDFRMLVQTDLFANLDENKIITDYLQSFRLNLCFDYMGETPDCIKESSDYGWGYVRSASIPGKLKDVLKVSYPERYRDTEQDISIVFKSYRCG